MTKFICPEHGEFIPKRIYYSYPSQACCPECDKMIMNSEQQISFIELPITEHIIETVPGRAAEIEYRDRNGNTVGFWAYGYWHPNYPYKGQSIPERSSGGQNVNEQRDD